MSDVTSEHARYWIPKLASDAVAAIEDGNLAEALFNLSQAKSMARDRLINELLLIFEADLEEPDTWPFEDVTWDWYDSSLELKNASPTVIFTDEQWQRISDLGFQRAWICYQDGTEKYYA